MHIDAENRLPYDTPQWVCLECGYNMVNAMPNICPFCGAAATKFMTWDTAEKVYAVNTYAVTNEVSQLRSEPKLGLEHAAYRIKTDAGAVWIDAPSVFNRGLDSVNTILFTHHHFLGAVNQYQRLWDAKVWLHELDAKHKLVAAFNIDEHFSDDFAMHGIEAYHTGGHTPGFTFYIYQDVLFICDYVFYSEQNMIFNPFGPVNDTRDPARHILQVIRHKSLNTVCGYNYIAAYDEWLKMFEALLLQWH